ncbi:complement C3-like isoform X2 [Larimichthys crocea]|uniref:complement C3-like isoform X2 n=1 Tax=Larimichthys crocea TaxID=215358 RepID=UPI000F5D5543|nr:complement C3-like isoform X2 [Larimichthys crocea]
MVSGRMVCRNMLCLLAFLAFSLADGSQLQVMSAPNLLRVGTAEKIFVECQDCTGGDIPVEIIVMNHPTKTTRLANTTVTLTSAQGFQALGEITIPVGDFSKDPNIKQYVYLQAQFPGRLLEKIVLVSFQSGYIFIQTDKTLYTPNSKVLYRMFALTPHMEPVETSVDIEIVTPEGIILPLDVVSLRSGIYSGDYQLSELVSSGLWKVVAKFHSHPQQSYSAEFKVKEYVLPSLEVKLMPMDSFFYVDSQELSITIKADYVTGENVDGMAYVIFGVIHQNKKNSFPSSLQRVAIQRGIGAVTLRREHITQTFPNILQLVGTSIYVSVSVLTKRSNEMVDAELRNIRIVTSPYTIHFRRTPTYFKPGMSFDVTVEVVNPDDSPAQGVAVVVDPGQVRGFTAANGLARLTINTQAGTNRLTITAKTDDPRITREKQATATMEALPYKTRNNNYIHIGVDTAELKLGDNLKVSVIFGRQQNSDITYLIMSKGQLVKNERYKTRGQILISQKVLITKELLPSFRIIAYFHTDDNEVVADSVWVDVKDSCMGSLRLESLRPAPSYRPHKMFGLKITGDPEAIVGMVAVDKSVYVLNNKHRLTQKKMWDIIEKYDTGCTPGGGKDSMSVFYDAGLLFESSASGTPYRLDLKCPAPSRRKRSDEDDMAYLDSYEIVSRTKFPESWLWADIHLLACPRQTPNCQTTSSVKNVPLPDSITTWQFTGISLSRTHGICVADPLEVIVRKDFFIDLRLPYSAVRGEQIEVKAILHNYSPDEITVRVDLTEAEHVCSVASKHGRYRQEVRVGAKTTLSVPFIIIPMRYGQNDIEVKAAVKDLLLDDGIRKMLRVVPEGVLIKSSKILILNPAEKGVAGKQDEFINSGIPLKDLVPNAPATTQIYLTGREQISALVENAISGNSMGTLIRQPSGSGEQNMIHMTMSVIATTYLDKTNQWETVGLEKRNEALQHINRGYHNELSYRKHDGSFAPFPSYQSSTWLTAYVAKVFAMASRLVQLQTSIICDAIKFLIVNTQQPDGMFREVGRVNHGEMIGDVLGTDSDASMTAFCLIAMQESRPLCAATVNSLPNSIDKAVAYLERRLPSLTNPYAVAVTSYALANENKLNREILYRFASPELSHWPVPKGNIYTLEATAYALLALVKTKAFKDARSVVRWFSQQQRVGGGYGSTQATMMVYQAVAEYWAVTELQYNLDVSIFMPGVSRLSRYNFNINNQHTSRIFKFNGINKDVNVSATGHGEATLTMVSHYYALPREKESDCQKFNLSVQLIPEKTDDDEKIYKLNIEVFFKDKVRDATMSVLDIGLLTGFTVNINDLQLMSRRHGSPVARYEVNTDTERSSLIMYLNKVSHTRPEEIAFRIHQRLKVGLLQPAAVSVYEYYEQNCSMQRKGKITHDERLNKVSETTQTSRIDFVYKVNVENLTHDLSTDIYTVRIVEVIKEESYDGSLPGKMCTFLSSPHCREALDLRKGKTYLIMGASEGLHKDEASQSCQYVLIEKTWIEYWPTEEECQTKEHLQTCLSMKELAMTCALFGCPTQVETE